MLRGCKDYVNITPFRSQLTRQSPSLGSRKDLVLENLGIPEQLLALHTRRPRCRLSPWHKAVLGCLEQTWRTWRATTNVGFRLKNKRHLESPPPGCNRKPPPRLGRKYNSDVVPFLRSKKSKRMFPIAIVWLRVHAPAVLWFVILEAALLLLPLGCNSGSPKPNSVTIPRAEYERLQAGESRRFLPFSDGVALDTQTGQFCKTYDWHNRPARRGYARLPPSPYEKAPLCIVFGRENTGSREPTTVTISRAEYERLQAAQSKRFQPFSNLSGVALDTQTGQVCKTIESLNLSRRVPRTVIPSPFENAPLCAHLR
jgi:hypothetical protein